MALKYGSAGLSAASHALPCKWGCQCHSQSRAHSVSKVLQGLIAFIPEQRQLGTTHAATLVRCGLPT